MAARLANHIADSTEQALVGYSSQVNDVHATFGKSMGWAMAVPDAAGPDQEWGAKGAMHCETAASVFDVVFRSVALAAYSPAFRLRPAVPRTSTHRTDGAPGSLLIRQDDGVHDLHRTYRSSSIQFPSAAAETGTIAERICLRSLNASIPESLNAPQLPFIAIRGWTRRCI